MSSQNQMHQHQHQQKPAQESSAAGWHVVGRYRTRTGQVGVEIRVSCRTARFAYTGKWGAGSGHLRDEMISQLRSMLAGRRGVVVDIPFGGLEVSA